MKKIIFIITVLICLTAWLSDVAWSQEVKFPRVSPKASVMQTVGLTDVTITYCRPGVKGRVIWGDLVPYDQVWRTGANEATTITFSNDVMIEDKNLPAGTYGLFTIPGKEEWSFVFSKQAITWGTYSYKEDQDVIRVKVKPAEAPHCEWMLFYFADLTDSSAKVVLHWDKLMVCFTVKIDTKGMVLKNIENSMNRYWSLPYNAANYAFESEMTEKAKDWVNISVSIKEMYWNMFLKAKIYKKLAKNKKEADEALKILEKAMFLVKDLPENQKQYAEEGKKLLEEWKTKK